MYVYITVVYIDFILCLENMLCKNIYIMKKNISSKNLSVPIQKYDHILYLFILISIPSTKSCEKNDAVFFPPLLLFSSHQPPHTHLHL